MENKRPPSKQPKVAMFPDYRRDNPYQKLLCKEIQAHGYEVEFPTGYRRVAPFSRLIRKMGEGAPDIIHLHWPDPFLRGRNLVTRWFYAWKLRVDLMCALKIVGGRKLAWTVHNLGQHDTASNFAERSFYKWLARRADVLFVHDDTLVQSLEEEFGASRQKTRVIPHGHYADYYGPKPERHEALRQTGLGKDAKVALFLGMLKPYKGLEMLIRIWPKVRSECPEAVLVIAGSGKPDYVKSIQDLCRKDPSIHLDARYVSDEEIPVLYGAASIAVFPFRKITTSGSIILSLSYDCPVVAPRLQSITAPLSFQDELLYEPASDEGLRLSLVRGLRSDPSPWKTEFARTREVYSWKSTASITARAYGQILQK